MKLSQASNSIADGDVEPGRKTDIDDARAGLVYDLSIDHVLTGHFLYEITNFLVNDAHPIEFCDCKHCSRIEVSVKLYVSAQEIQTAL